MPHPILNRIPFLSRFVDERFLEHRRRSTSVAALVGVAIAGGLFEFRLIVQHALSWDLFAVVSMMALSKLIMMLRYRFND